MVYIKLEYNDDYVILNKVNNMFDITTTKEWKFLTQFTTAYLFINYPGGNTVLPIDKKFINNQDYRLTNDLDFNFIPIIPFGNINNMFCPFTGNFDGNNFCIKNIEIKDNTNNGLFGVIKYSTIKNLTLQNIIIKQGKYNGCLFGKGFQIILMNINIIGNININGYYNASLGAIIEGNMKNINICIDGNVSTIIAHDYSGTADNISVISNLENSPGYFINICGIVRNSNFISFNKVNNPFYINSNHHMISDCYYFQLNNDNLPIMQILENSYYRNLNKIIYTPNIIWDNWIKIDSNYYLKNVINYIFADANNIEPKIYHNIIFYNIISGISNSNIYMNMKNEIIYNSTVLYNPLKYILISLDTIEIDDNANNITILQHNIAILEQKMQTIGSFTDYIKNCLERLKSI
jgi:hypothetical protein